VAGTEPHVSVGSALAWANEVLAGFDSARLDAQLLLGHVVGHDRAWILAHPEAAVPEDQLREFTSLVDRRAVGEPVAYLRGSVHWRDLELSVGPGVLVPRPETEEAVEIVAEIAGRRLVRRAVDVGTGSGAIAIALARMLPDARVVATDAHETALRFARANVARYGLEERIEVRHGDFLEPVADEPDVVVANLPYLSGARMATLPRDVRFEPEEALHGGSSGLDAYEKLFAALQRRGWRSAVVIEIDPEQEVHARRLIESVYPEESVRFVPDLAGRTRFAAIDPVRGGTGWIR
jgi:release factor glutamine methyltransferase